MAECYQKTGEEPIIVCWIDNNRRRNNKPIIDPSQRLARINAHKGDDLFAAIPPLEALKFLRSTTTIGNNGEVIRIIDVSRAFFHTKITGDIYIQLPSEDKGFWEEIMCGKLQFPIYGTRGATLIWHNECA